MAQNTTPFPTKKERNFPHLDLSDQSTLNATAQPVLVIQSPKTPTLSRKLKAVSLDSDQQKETTNLEACRDVFSMPNTPKRQIKHKLTTEFDEARALVPNFSTNLKKFASNNSISGSQTLKTLPEIMTLHDFSHDIKTEQQQPVVRVRAKGLLERRGSNASLTIDLGSNSNITNDNAKITPIVRLNTAKSVSNLNLTSFGAALATMERCTCLPDRNRTSSERRKSQETCGNCIIYESIPSKANSCKTTTTTTTKCTTGIALKRCCNCCSIKCRRKSLSNENLYVPPCGFCQTGAFKECTGASKHCKGYRKAYYPRQPDLDSSQLLSEDFKLHLQNVQYLQTAGNVLSIADLKSACEVSRVPKLHLEFWEVPLNLQEKCYVSGSQTRNRYRGVLPNEHSRVHLPGPQGYIHANYIKGPDYTETAYIATQGPMAHTCEDFWEMVWFNNSTYIVMLTGLVEKGRNKCELYFPLGKKTDQTVRSYYRVKTTKLRDKFTFDQMNTSITEEEIVDFEELNDLTYGNYKIKYLNEDTLNECTIRHFELTKCDKQQKSSDTRVVHHYWFHNWHDHKMTSPERLLETALHVLNMTSANNDISKTSTKLNDLRTGNGGGGGGGERKRSLDGVKPPVVVHCSAGIGRTGCFLAILNGIQQLRVNHNVDVLAILCSLRLNRGGMVQTAEQYELIHRVLNLYALSHHSDGILHSN